MKTKITEIDNRRWPALSESERASLLDELDAMQLGGYLRYKSDDPTPDEGGGDGPHSGDGDGSGGRGKDRDFSDSNSGSDSLNMVSTRILRSVAFARGVAGVRPKQNKAEKSKVASGQGTLPGFHPEWNGAGGFKPGNQYGARHASGGSKSSPSHSSSTPVSPPSPLGGQRRERQGSLFDRIASVKDSPRAKPTEPHSETVDKSESGIPDLSRHADNRNATARHEHAANIRSHRNGLTPTTHPGLVDRAGEAAGIRRSALALRRHRENKTDYLGDEHATLLHKVFSNPDRGAALAGVDPVAHARAEIGAAHVLQREMNRRDAKAKPVHQIQGEMHPRVKQLQEEVAAIKTKLEEKKSDLRERQKDHDKAELAEAKARKILEKTPTPSVTRIHQNRLAELDHAKSKLRETQADLDPEKVSSWAGFLRKKEGDLDHAIKIHGIGSSDYNHANHILAHPDLIAPGPIAERIGRYKVGEAKIHHIRKAADRHDQNTKEAGHVTPEESNAISKTYLAAHATKDQSKINEAMVAVREHTKKLVEANKKIGEASHQFHREVSDILETSRPITIHRSSVHEGEVNHKGETLSEPSGTAEKAWDEGRAWLEKVTAHGDNNNTIHVRVGVNSGARAHHNETLGHIQISDRETPSVVVHEYGHALESHLRTGGRKHQEIGQEFLAHRVGNETPIDMKKQFGSGDAGEMGRKDRFSDAMGGDDYRAHYTGKDYGKNGPTEVTSMGLEELHRSPARLVRNDPELSKYVLGTLDGSLR